MKTLFVAWKDQVETRGWFPVGRLDADIEAESYRFRYLQGAVEAAADHGFEAFDSFPELNGDYISAELFPFFTNRLQNSNQPGFRDYLHRLALDDGTAPVDPIEVLAVSEGRRVTDNLEIFPRVSPAADGSFAIKFFLHGWRYLQDHSRECVLGLEAGCPLRVSIETNNPATGWAVQLLKDDHVIGYAPRYLVGDLVEVMSGCTFLDATVSRINPPPAPPSQRVLVDFTGCWPDGYRPMSGPQFDVLAGDDEQTSDAASVVTDFRDEPVLP